MSRVVLLAALLAALPLAARPALAKDPWSEVRARQELPAPSDGEAAAAGEATANGEVLPALAPASVPRPVPKPAVMPPPALRSMPLEAPRPIPRPADLAQAVPAAAPVAAPVSAAPAPMGTALMPAEPPPPASDAPVARVGTLRVPQPPAKPALGGAEALSSAFRTLPVETPAAARAPVADPFALSTLQTETLAAEPALTEPALAEPPAAEAFAEVVPSRLAFTAESFDPRTFAPMPSAAPRPASAPSGPETDPAPAAASSPAPVAAAASAPSPVMPAEEPPPTPVESLAGLLSLPTLAVFSPAQATEAVAPEAAREGAAPEDAHAGAADAEAATSPELPPPPPLYREVRELQRLQDRMAAGEANALSAQNALIARIDEGFRVADSSAWSDPQNARALIVFALSGGGPGVLRAVLGKGAAPAIDERLLRGTLAYLEGREPEALKQLGEIDARELPDSLAGQVALAQAALWVRRDPARASVLLGRARLMAPGTLVEEAALRREIFIAAQANELETFERLTSTYLARYRHSVYAGNFRQRFAAALTRMSFIDSAEEFQRVHDLLAPLEPESRREVALLIAQAALAQGKTTAAALASELVLKGTVFGSLEADRATLYRAAAIIAAPGRFDEASAALAGVARERFSGEDVRLLGAALAVAASIGDAVNVTIPPATGPVGEPGAPEAQGPVAPETGKDGAAGAPPPAILASAQAALDAADKALGDAPL